MNIGDSIVITNPNSDNSSYRCKIIDKSRNYLFVDYPIDINTNKSAFLPREKTLKITYIKKGIVYEFSSFMKQYIHLNVPALMIPLPQVGEIRKIQRREFVRIQTNIDVAVHCPKSSFSAFTSVTSDISAGGACIILPSPIEVKRNQLICLYFVLQFGDSNVEYIHTEAEIIRTHQNNNVHMLSVRFLLNVRSAQDKIIAYCFNQQRKLRKKEIN